MHNILAVLIASEFISEDREQQKYSVLSAKYGEVAENINMNIAKLSADEKGIRSVYVRHNSP